MTSKSSLKYVNLETRFPKNYKKFHSVILGAGFSAEFGYPLADRLLKEISTFYSPNPKKLIEFNRFLTHFYQDFELNNSKFPDIEDLLGMLEVAKHYASIRSGGVGYHWKETIVAELENRIKRMICEYLWSFQEENQKSDLSKIDKMIDYFGSNTIYVSFNYDLLLETALSKRGIEYCYGISKNPEIVSILKPHGSINWFYRDRFRLHQDVEMIKYGDDFLIANTLDFADLEKCKGRDPVLISPTPNKRITEHELKRVWTGFSSTMHNCKSLHIIGYSLPNADRLARLVIRRAGPRHQNCKNITIIRRTESEAHYQKFISPVAKQFKSTFGGWADSLA